MDGKRVLAIGATAAVVAMVIMVAAPALAPPGSYTDLDGSPSFVDHPLDGILDVPYLIGDVLCHQQDGRSFHINGSQMPICIRDTGLLLGLILGLLACIPLSDRLHDRRSAILGAILLTVTFVEWIMEPRLGDMPTARFLSGVVSGIGAALILGWLLFRNKGETGRRYA